MWLSALLHTGKPLRLHSLLVCLLLFALPCSALPQDIFILQTSDAEPYDIFTSSLKKHLRNPKVQISIMNNDISKGKEILADRALIGDSEAILALGSKAAWVAKDQSELPVFYSMLSRPERYHLQQLSGVSLDIPYNNYLQVYNSLFPGASRIGIIYSDKNQDEIDLIRAQAKRHDITIIASRIESLSEISGAIEKTLNQSDALWLISDPLVTSSPRLIKEAILLPAVKSNMPVIGLNKWSVANGALFNISGDYEYMGQQVADIINQHFNGSHEIRQYTPSATKTFFNRKVLQGLMQTHTITIPNNAYYIEDSE